MPNLNKVLLMGNLTRDPELRYLPSNMAVVALGLAVNRRWKNQAGEQGEEVTFIDCECFGKTAEVINQYFRKGKPIFIEGRLKLDQWQDKEGHNRSKLKVVVENFQFIESKGGDAGDHASQESSGGYQAPAAPQQSRGPQPPRKPMQAGPGGPPPHQPIGEEEIPF